MQYTQCKVHESGVWRLSGRRPPHSRMECAPCKVFRPTVEEFSDFSQCMLLAEQLCDGDGIIKIVPPEGFRPCADIDQLLEKTVVRKPVRQVALGGKGVFQLVLVERSKMSVETFRKEAEKTPPPKGPVDELERKFWKNIAFNPATYGADTSGSFFEDCAGPWNLNKLSSLLSRVPVSIPGVTTSFLYFGMWKALFAWHIEDQNLHSINYLHFGASKVWYSVPPAHYRRVEALAAKLFPEDAKQCPQFLRHKSCMISPTILLREGIPIIRAVQYPGEMIVNMPCAYHSGFNTGFNCAEATNFATPKWVPFGFDAQPCTCVPDSVRIDMSAFLDCNVGEGWDADVVVMPDDFKKPAANEALSGQKRGLEVDPHEFWRQCVSCSKWRKVDAMGPMTQAFLCRQREGTTCRMKEDEWDRARTWLYV